MSMRFAGCAPPTRTVASDAASRLMTASRMCRCRSTSGTTHLQVEQGCRHVVGAASLVEQRRERGKIVVPLNQRRAATEPADGVGIELPRGVGDVRGVRVDEDLAARSGFILLARESTHMELADRRGG